MAKRLAGDATAPRAGVDPVELRLLAGIDGVKTWKRGGKRAPHKPLLLLLALGRVQRGESRVVDFPAIEGPMRRLLEEFGPSRQSHHPEYPFWRLQGDGLWTVQDADAYGHRRSNTDPPVSELRDAPALGGLPEEYDRLLRARPDVLQDVARRILDEHFEPSLHADLAAAVGLDLVPRVGSSRRIRDPEFPLLIFRAYEHRCAACGLELRIDGRAVGLEAAHVKWHSHDGPSTVDNGLCLCPTHHKALDLGAIGLDERNAFVVSSRVAGSDATGRWLLDLAGRPLRGPQRGAPAPRPEFVAWHRREVFKSPARAG